MGLEVGQRLRRREPVNDVWDDVEIRGSFSLGETSELVVSPSLGFSAPVTATPESLLKIYTLDIDGAPKMPEMRTWKTPLEEVTA